MANLHDLADRLLALAKDGFDDKTNQLKVRVATAVIQDLIYSTPVDSSQALSNWQITLGDPSAHRIPPIYPGSKGSTQDASSEAALALALSILKTVKPGQSVWIQNVLPYIRRLNDGYSYQAPAGFVERAQLIGRKIAEQGLK